MTEADALIQKWSWYKVPIGIDASHYVLKAEECFLEIYPRPSYCDRGQWEMHAMCPGYPQNPNPVDAADMFPRVYFLLAVAQFEGVLWMDKRKYTPKVETTER
ncbi:MAG: hypothetical protein V3V08_13120 [Nannocystaceae bacterium]